MLASHSIGSIVSVQTQFQPCRYIHACTNKTHSLANLQDLIPTYFGRHNYLKFVIDRIFKLCLMRSYSIFRAMWKWLSGYFWAKACFKVFVESLKISFPCPSLLFITTILNDKSKNSQSPVIVCCDVLYITYISIQDIRMESKFSCHLVKWHMLSTDYHTYLEFNLAHL